MRAPFLSIVLFAVMAARAQIARGQQPPATIPTELALALLDHGESESGNRGPRIVVGHAPNGMPASLASAKGAVIVGGIEYARSAILVLAFTLPPNQVLKAYDEHVLAAGWKLPPSGPMEGSGFVSSGYSPYWGYMYCSDSGAVHVSYSAAPNGGTYLKVENTRNTEMSFCARRDRFMSRPEFVFPALRAPAGMTQQSGGGGSGGDNVERSARLMGALEPPEIVAHYLKQLDSAGWKMGGILAGGAVAVVPAEAKDSLGGIWTGALTAWRISPLEVEVNIKMARPSQR